MKLICKIGKNLKREVTVKPDDELNILLGKLSVPKTTKFVFNGVTYSLASIFTFREINMRDNAQITALPLINLLYFCKSSHP